MKKFLVVLMALIVAIPVTAGAVIITFDTTPPQGGPVSDFYKSTDGVYFTPGSSSNYPMATIDTWTFDGGSTYQLVPVLTDASSLTGGGGDFFIHFVNPVTNVSFDSGMWGTPSVGIVYLFSNNTDSPSFLFPTTNPGFIGSFSNDPDLNQNGFDVYRFDFGPTVVSMIYFDSSGNLGVGGASITNLSFTTPVPEPGTMILLGSGLAGLAAYRRKRRKK